MGKYIKWSALSAFVLSCIFLAVAIYAWNYNPNGQIPDDYRRSSNNELATRGLKTIDANGLRFVYRESGKGPLVLLIHGYPGFGYTYKEIMPRLVKAGYHVVEYAQRGIVPTDIPTTGDYSMFALGKDVLALIKAFGEEKAYIVGHDWGATAAYGAAILGPQNIERMVTIAVPHPLTTAEPSPEAFERAPHFFWFQFGFLSEWMAGFDNFAYLEKLIRDIQGSWNMPENQIQDMKQNMSNPGRLGASIGYYRSLRTHPEQLESFKRSKIEVPMLTINSSKSAMFGARAYELSAKEYSKYFKLKTIKNVGHFIPQEAPDAVLKEIVNFFSATIPDRY